MAVAIALGGMALFYFLGYRGYSGYLTRRIFGIQGDEPTPAHDPKLADGFDYVPTRFHILWGHHYTSIAGAAPIIGPAVAVIWGWLPAVLWVVFGTIFIGAVHDFGALVLSARNRGATLADLAGDIITPRVRILFQVIVYFLIWVVLAVFSFAIGKLFTKYPASVIPVNFEILAALVIGWQFHHRKAKILIPSLISVVLLYALIGVGIAYPIEIDPEAAAAVGLTPETVWAVLLLLYAAVASVLPVWLLLQPRDYINSHQLIVGLVLLIAGLIFMNPAMSAPALRLHPPGAPPLFPILFVTIACGSISGFHGLVSSGTTSKQLDRMSEARAIGYGGMLGEGTLALIATLAVAAGLRNWDRHYASWNGSGIQAVSNFVEGGAEFLRAVWIPDSWAAPVVAILAISFAATSMDTGARIQRLIVAELGGAARIPLLQNRFLATALAVAPSVPLVLAGPRVWNPLWLLFGTTNQLIGGLTFLVLFTYLYRARRPVWPVAIPMVFVLSVTTGAMVYKLWDWTRQLGTDAAQASMLTIVLGAVILGLELWILGEAVLIIRKLHARVTPREGAP